MIITLPAFEVGQGCALHRILIRCHARTLVCFSLSNEIKWFKEKFCAKFHAL